MCSNNNIPPVGVDGFDNYSGSREEYKYIYKVNDIHMDYTGDVKTKCFFVRNDPVTPIYKNIVEFVRELKKDSKYKVGYVANRRVVEEKFDTLKKLYDNNLCQVYFGAWCTPVTLRLDKFDDFKEAVDYKMSYIMDGYEEETYPFILYGYLGKDPVQKSEEEIRQENFDKIFAGNDGGDDGGSNENVEGVVAANLDTNQQ